MAVMKKGVQIGGKLMTFFRPKVRNVSIKSVFFILGQPLKYLIKKPPRTTEKPVEVEMILNFGPNKFTFQ